MSQRPHLEWFQQQPLLHAIKPYFSDLDSFVWEEELLLPETVTVAPRRAFVLTFEQRSSQSFLLPSGAWPQHPKYRAKRFAFSSLPEAWHLPFLLPSQSCQLSVPRKPISSSFLRSLILFGLIHARILSSLETRRERNETLRMQ